MSRIKGMRDIITHGSLDRKGLLIGVAKNMHQGTGSSGRRGAEGDFGGDVNRHIFKKPAPAKRPVPPATRPPLDPNLIEEYLITTARDLLEEMSQAVAEGWPIAIAEFERLERQLKDLEGQ